jgi:hypothetical protein
VASPIPTDLRRPHPLVVSTRNNYERARFEPDGRLRLRPKPGVVRLLVSKAELRRALLVLQGLFNEAERRGYEVRATEDDRYREKAGVAIVAAGHAYTVSMMELTKPTPLTDAEIERWRKDNNYRLRWGTNLRPPSTRPAPSGKLRLSLPDRWHGARTNWTEGPRGDLGTKFDSIFEEIDRRAVEDTARAEQRAREAEEQRRQEAERAERARLARIDQVRADKLLEQVSAWRRAADVREYVAAMRERLPAVDAECRGELMRWLEWADQFASRTDPLESPSSAPALDMESDQVGALRMRY